GLAVAEAGIDQGRRPEPAGEAVREVAPQRHRSQSLVQEDERRAQGLARDHAVLDPPAGHCGERHGARSLHTLSGRIPVAWGGTPATAGARLPLPVAVIET